eukprot:225830_1
MSSESKTATTVSCEFCSKNFDFEEIESHSRLCRCLVRSQQSEEPSAIPCELCSLAVPFPEYSDHLAAHDIISREDEKIQSPSNDSASHSPTTASSRPNERLFDIFHRGKRQSSSDSVENESKRPRPNSQPAQSSSSSFSFNGTYINIGGTSSNSARVIINGIVVNMDSQSASSSSSLPLGVVVSQSSNVASQSSNNTNASCSSVSASLSGCSISSDENFVEGSISAIRDSLSGRKHCRVELCDSTLDYYYRAWRDQSWGCGFRNLQTLTSVLVKRPEYAEIFDGAGSVPPIEFLQRCLDYAHAQGFDPGGFEQLSFVQGTDTWVGAVDQCALLRSYGIRANVNNFELSDSTHSHTAMLEWVWEYFVSRNQGPAEDRFVPPLYLQHLGHSRTIVGATRDAKTGVIRLVILDPSCEGAGPGLVSDLRQRKVTRVLRTNAQMGRKIYQILSVNRGLMGKAERELSKIVLPVGVPSKP